jgi:hypothetical protein
MKSKQRFKTFFQRSFRFLDNVEKFGRAGQAADDKIILRMRIGCWISKGSNTLRICNTYCFTVATMVTRSFLSVTLYVHCLSCLYLCTYVRKVMNS